MDLNEYKEDLSKQKNGVSIHTNAGEFIVRRFGTKESNAVLADIEREDYNPFENLTDTEKAERKSEQMAKWLATYGVCDWHNVKENGDQVKFNKKIAYEVFMNPAYFLSLNLRLINAAMDYENYLVNEVEKDIEQVKK